ncbi:hypothetical protein RCN52_01785, partial [Escherichia marmotae]|nr:hypothetical protein [Escherichia marmotae]
MLPLFKAFCFFCILLLGSVLIRGNNNLISPAVRQEFFYQKKQPHPFIRKLMRALATLILTLHTSLLITQHLPFCNT